MAGLAAALQCEKSGKQVLILDASDRIGGRIKTDEINGFLLDHGFQVMLSSYSMANALLNMKSLDLKNFTSGSVITDANGSFRLGDPIRNKSFLLPTLFSRAGSINDKIKLWKLQRELQSGGDEAAFLSSSITTMEYLRQYGFSDQIIHNFFVPFFGGIFLESALETNASMFRFVMRQFSSGYACLPANGMQALPDQLRKKLKSTKIKLNVPVREIFRNLEVKLESGEIIKASKVIVACDPGKILPQVAQALDYRSTTTIYFEGKADARNMQQTIGLDVRNNSPINNYCRLDEIQPSYAPKGKSLWSVTVREKSEPDTTEVLDALASLIGAAATDLKHLKTYKIPRALPVVGSPQHHISSSQTQISPHIHLAGDYMLHASIEGALRSGVLAADAVCDTSTW